jgi:hypothetical protein
MQVVNSFLPQPRLACSEIGILLSIIIGPLDLTWESCSCLVVVGEKCVCVGVENRADDDGGSGSGKESLSYLSYY